MARAARVSVDLKRFDPSAPANLQVQIVHDGERWGENCVEVNRQYLDAISGRFGVGRFDAG